MSNLPPIPPVLLRRPEQVSEQDWNQAALDDIMQLPEAESDVCYKEKLVSCCKGLTRWGINRRQACPWFYVAPALLTSLWFSVMHEEMAYKLTCISDDPLVFEMTTPLHRSIRRRN